MKLMATAIITLFATIALAEGTAHTTAPAAAPAAPAAEKAAPAATAHKMDAHADMMKKCETMTGAEKTKCEDAMKKAHGAKH